MKSIYRFGDFLPTRVINIWFKSPTFVSSATYCGWRSSIDDKTWKFKVSPPLIIYHQRAFFANAWIFDICFLAILAYVWYWLMHQQFLKSSVSHLVKKNFLKLQSRKWKAESLNQHTASKFNPEFLSSWLDGILKSKSIFTI